MRPITPIAALAVAGAVALAGCGNGSGSGSSSSATSHKSSGSSTSSSSSSSSGGSGSHTLKLAADPNKIAFDTTALTAKAGHVTIDFKNPSAIPHAVTVQGNGVNGSTKTLTNASAKLTLDLKPGKYVFFCPVDGHRQAGMQGTLTVK
jgi:plastocyanin